MSKYEELERRIKYLENFEGTELQNKKIKYIMNFEYERIIDRLKPNLSKITFEFGTVSIFTVLDITVSGTVTPQGRLYTITGIKTFADVERVYNYLRTYYDNYLLTK